MPVHRILLAVALGAAVAPPLAALPAAAAPTCANLSGSASADLVRVQALDPHAFALGRSPVGLRVAAARATLSATHTTASARGLETPLAVPVATATQQAPPARLTPTAGGPPTGPSGRYASPLIEVPRPTATTQTLAAPAKRMDIPVAPATLGAFGLTGNGAVVLRLSIGTVSQRITATAVTAEAATVRGAVLWWGWDGAQ